MSVNGLKIQWSPTGIARGTLHYARVGRHLPTNVGTHPSTGIARGLLLPGSMSSVLLSGGSS